MANLFTCQMHVGKKLVKEGIVEAHELIDTSVKSANNLFAPTWNMVNSWKEGKLSSEDYRKQYLTMMRKSYRENKQEWHNIFDGKKNIVLMCYCNPDEFCHRRLLAEILVKLGFDKSTELNDKYVLDGYNEIRVNKG